MNIIQDIVQSFNDAFDLTYDETEESISYNEQVAKALGGDLVTTVPMQQWYAPFAQLNDYRKDNSYNTLSYLSALGYEVAIWELSEYHPEVDVCDTLNGRQFTINELLLNAQHNPPSPIFTLSHPDCFCFLKCFPPNGPEGIPDTAPGLPISRMDNVPYHTMDKYKNKLYKNMFEVYIDSFTLLPPQDKFIAYSSVLKDEKIIKYGYKPEYRRKVTPVALVKDITAFLPLYFRQPLKSSLNGIQVLEGNNFSVVYLNDFNRSFILPSNNLKKFKFSSGKEINSKSLRKGLFISVNNKLGVVRWISPSEFNYYSIADNKNITQKHVDLIQLFR